MQIEPPPHLLDLFTQRLTAVGGHVHRAAGSPAAAATIQAIAAATGDDTVWTSPDVAGRAPGLVAALADAGLQPRLPGTPEEVRDQPLGLAIAGAAVAETGSVVMVETEIPGRAVTLMTGTLVVVCPAASLLPSLEDAVPLLRATSAAGASYTTLITGPSRTADIERQLTVGVQGPGVYHVVLVDSLT